MPLLMLFLDGVGLGESDLKLNPLASAGMLFFRELLAGRPLTLDAIGNGLDTPTFVCRPTETTMGVPGLPQSATGQTAIFSGVNAARAAGRHINGFPTKALRRILQEHSLFLRLHCCGLRAVFANAFTREYFESTRRGKWRHSVTTTAAMAGKCRLRMIPDLQNGEAVYQDIINEQLQAKGYQLPLIRPETAAANLVRLAARQDFTLFEYFQTDHCGHKQNWDLALELLNRLDRFIGAIAGQLCAHNLDLLIVSDHGNIEDLAVKTHTCNPVPTIAIGERAHEFGEIKTLLDIYPAVLRYFGVPLLDWPPSDPEYAVAFDTTLIF